MLDPGRPIREADILARDLYPAILRSGETALDTISIGMLPVGQVDGAIAILKDAGRMDRDRFGTPRSRA